MRIFLFNSVFYHLKADDSMVQFFIDSLAPVIRECIGYHICDGSWAIVTTPMRRSSSWR